MTRNLHSGVCVFEKRKLSTGADLVIESGKVGVTPEHHPALVLRPLHQNLIHLTQKEKKQ